MVCRSGRLKSQEISLAGSTCDPRRFGHRRQKSNKFLCPNRQISLYGAITRLQFVAFRDKLLVAPLHRLVAGHFGVAWQQSGGCFHGRQGFRSG